MQWNSAYFTLVGLDSSTTDDNNSLPNVKQEPVSDDDCPSDPEGFGFDGENDPFDEDDTFVHSKFRFFITPFSNVNC